MDLLLAFKHPDAIGIMSNGMYERTTKELHPNCHVYQVIELLRKNLRSYCEENDIKLWDDKPISIELLTRREFRNLESLQRRTDKLDRLLVDIDHTGPLGKSYVAFLNPDRVESIHNLHIVLVTFDSKVSDETIAAMDTISNAILEAGQIVEKV